VGPRAGLDAVTKRNLPSTRRESNHERPTRSQSLYRLNHPVDILVCLKGTNVTDEHKSASENSGGNKQLLLLLLPPVK
jgi:hypothetical protein